MDGAGSTSVGAPVNRAVPAAKVKAPPTDTRATPAAPSLQPSDGLTQVVPTVEEAVGPSREHQVARGGVGGPGRARMRSDRTEGYRSPLEGLDTGLADFSPGNSRT